MTTKKKPGHRTDKSRARRIAKKSAEVQGIVELVVVYTASGLLPAQVIKSKLESAGIQAILKYEAAQSVFPVTVDGMGEVQVLVSRENEHQAREILNEP